VILKTNEWNICGCHIGRAEKQHNSITENSEKKGKKKKKEKETENMGN
jgi:hypothetical protein